MTNGFVSLVGAGPGDPELLTVKALRRIKDAEVVVYDRLVSNEILELIPAGVSRLSVGKSAGKHCVPQDQINEIIVDLALSGRKVVRLKGGDPYLFGRGGEEALVLRENNIQFDVVPGITAATGCSAYSGIPLTHRGLNHGVRFLTGHLHDETGTNWEKIADPECTLVIYMGLMAIESICEKLQFAGLSAQTPAAAVHGGTREYQQKIISTLSSLPEAVKLADLQSPVLVIIGEVVSLSEQLDWFQQQEEQDVDATSLNSIRA